MVKWGGKKRGECGGGLFLAPIIHKSRVMTYSFLKDGFLESGCGDMAGRNDSCA